MQEDFGSEQQGVRLEAENSGSIGSSGRGVRDVSRTRGTSWKREFAAGDMLFAAEEDIKNVEDNGEEKNRLETPITKL